VTGVTVSLSRCHFVTFGGTTIGKRLKGLNKDPRKHRATVSLSESLCHFQVVQSDKVTEKEHLPPG